MRSRSDHRTLAVVLSGFTAFLTLYATQPLLPLFAQTFHASRLAASLTVTAATLGVAISAPLIGNIADRLGRKHVIVFSAALMTLTTLVAATAESLPALILWRFLQGLFTPGISAITVAYIQEEWAASGAGEATAAYVGGTIAGGFTGRFVTGIVAQHASWHVSFVALGLMSAAATAVLARWLPKEQRFVPRTSGRSTLAALSSHLKNRRLAATYAAGFCVLFSLMAMFTYVTFYLAAPPFRLSTAALGSLFFVYLVGAVVTPWCGRAIDRFGHRTAITCAMGTSIAGAVLTLSHDLVVVVAGLAMCCTGVFIAQSTSSTWIGLSAQHDKALAVGLYVTFYYAGGSAGGALPGIVWNAGGWPACVGLIASVQMITIVIAQAWWRDSSGRRVLRP